MHPETTTQQAPKKPIKGALICILGGIAAFSLLVAAQPTKLEVIASKVALAKKEAQMRVAREDSIRAAFKAQEENTVAAKTLLRDYKADANKASIRYTGRNLYVEGKIDVVNVRSRYSNFLTFNDEKFGPSISCSLEDKNEASHLKPGDYVAVYGMCVDSKSDVRIEHARIVPTIAAWKIAISSK